MGRRSGLQELLLQPLVQVQEQHDRLKRINEEWKQLEFDP